MSRTRFPWFACALGVLTALMVAPLAHAQGVTTGSITGIVIDPQGGVVPGVAIVATHEPSGTQYEAVTRGDGRFLIPAVRVGGPYRVSAMLPGFRTEVKNDVSVGLGVSADLAFKLSVAAISEEIVVIATTEPVFSKTHTGAATAVLREELGTLPTVSGRINDMARLSPQYSGSGNLAGQDNRMNNITVDGSYFNNSFGIAGQPGDRTGVAPISLEAIEQFQISVAPFDVRQGNFVGGGLNTVTRSGTNKWVGSAYYRFRNESFVGKEAAGQPFTPGTFETTNTGEWVGGPIMKNKLFVFESFENQQDTRPLNTFTSNPGGVAAAGNTTRVLASDLTALSSFLSSRFGYDTGPFDSISRNTPGKPFLVKADYNANNANKVTVRYNMLNSNTPVNLSSSSSLGNPSGRQTFSTNFLNFAGSNYSILENIRSGITEWNSIIGNSMSNNLIVGYTRQDESRGGLDTLFPFVDILDGAGVAYTSFGSEPFTPNNELRYNTFQAQDSFTKVTRNHSFTFGGAVEKYHSENIFFPGKQSAYVYNSLADFNTDANGYLAAPGRTVSPVTLRRFQVRYLNIPGLDKPTQPLDVWYTSAYVQDEWRPKVNLTVTGGVRVDVAAFGATGFDNPAVDSLSFRDQNGNPIAYNTGALPKKSPLWSPRAGFNWDVNGNLKTQVRGGTGVFTGKPAYVWISNQIGNTGMLTGLVQVDNTTAFPFNPNPDAYKPTTVTGAPASSVDLAVTDPNFKFPQLWRSNIAIDRRLPWRMIATGEFIYSRDVNGMAYINANLPAAQSSFTGLDSRPRWVGTSCAAPTPTACVSRINNASGNQIIQNMVLQNQSIGRSWTASASLQKGMGNGAAFRTGYSYGESRNTIDPGSIAAGSWTNNPIVTDPNNPVLANSSFFPGHRFYLQATYTRQYFGLGATTVAAFFDARPNVVSGNTATSYIFSADMNGDTAANDLIYIPRDQSEMNFRTLTTGGRTFTAFDQAAAFDAYIDQDPYLSQHRGQYADRNGLLYPFVRRIDLSLVQDVFHKAGGARHSGQIRLDITNFGNLLNHDWGAGRQTIQNRILQSPQVDAQGRVSYTLPTVNTSSGPVLIGSTFQTTAATSDVYVMMLSFRYTFN